MIVLYANRKRRLKQRFRSPSSSACSILVSSLKIYDFTAALVLRRRYPSELSREAMGTAQGPCSSHSSPCPVPTHSELFCRCRPSTDLSSSRHLLCESNSLMLDGDTLQSLKTDSRNCRPLPQCPPRPLSSLFSTPAILSLSHHRPAIRDDLICL